MGVKLKIRLFFFVLLTVCMIINCTGIKQLFSKKYEIYPTPSAHPLYPCELCYGYVYFEDGLSTYIPFTYGASPEWGRGLGTHLLNNDNKFTLPVSISIGWLSIVEKKFYELDDAPLPKERIKELLEMTYVEDKKHRQLYSELVIGMAPYGGLAIWLNGVVQRTFVAWLQGKEADIDFSDYRSDSTQTTEEYCEWQLYNNNEKANENLQKNGFPGKELFENYMQQFNYKIRVEFEDKEVLLEWIEMWYYNGERDGAYLPMSGEHALYAMRAKPYKITLHWNVGGSHYEGFFWTDENKIVGAFSEFYNGNMQKESELIIEIGADNLEYGFYLSDASAKVQIPWDDMELIIFKDQQAFASHNYHRAEGKWRF